MSDQGAKEATKRDRSPKFPYIGLAKALERIDVLYGKVKRHDARVVDIAKDWELSPKSSSTDRTVAALQAFGLVEDAGSGDVRKIKLSDLGARILADQRPGIKDALLAEAAMKPPMMAEYARRWSGGRPEDAHALSQLQFEGKFTEEGARIFLRAFDETIRYARSGQSDKEDAQKADNGGEAPRANVGDVVQWTSNGVDQFAEPAEVTAVSGDGQWLWVKESKTGIPMNEVVVLTSAAPTTPVVRAPPPMPAHLAAAATGVMSAGLPSYQSGGVREEKFALKEGDVVIRYPQTMSADSVEDLAAYIQIFLKKAKREAAH